MNKKETYGFLTAQGVTYEVMEHGAVYNMEEMEALDLPYEKVLTKNLSVRDDKKQCYYLITVKGEQRVDLKVFRAIFGTRRLSFANEDEMNELLGVAPGSVTPLGLLNDTDCRVRFFIDKGFVDSLIGVHPNENTATVSLKTADLIRIVKEHVK